MAFFSDLDPIPPDPILGMAQLFANDKSPDKVDLGIGIYKDESGAAPVLRSVKTAERWLVENQPSKAYISSAGNPAFNSATASLILGTDHPALSDDRVRSVQTPGGTSALRVAGDFVRTHNPEAKMWLPDPTWANHPALYEAAGFRLEYYPYYDRACARLKFEAMLDAISGVARGDVVLLHGCCHNPTGADLTEPQWDAVAERLGRSGALPIVDLAYQGFGAGLARDAYGVRKLARDLPEILVASSYSKNFALYRERVGALTLVSRRGSDADQVRAHVMRTIRTNYSMPPDHGAAVVVQVLSDPTLRAAWERELTGMCGRIHDMRALLVEALRGHSSRDYRFIEQQQGMFTLLGLKPDEVRRLREQYSVHISSSGRINVAGLTRANVGHVARALAAVQKVAA